MSLQYAGGTRVNYTFTDAGTRADLVAKLETQLGNAGWSTISGGGSSDVLMKSAVTPDGLSIRVRLLEPGSGNCAQFTIKNNAGTLTSQIFYLLPGAFDWRIVANKFGFFMFRTGAAQRLASRAVLAAGTIWVPSFVLSLMGSDLNCGWTMGNGASDTTAAANSWRNSLGLHTTTNTWRLSSLYTSYMNNYTVTNDAMPRFMLAIHPHGSNIAYGVLKWQDDSYFQSEAVMGWSPDSTTSSITSRWKGQLYDGMILTGASAVVGESTVTFDGHTWIAITDQCDANLGGLGTLYIAVD